MDDVVACLLLFIVVILYMTSSTPERFRRSWFWGVTTGECTIKKSEVEDKKLSGDVTEITKTLRSKFEVERKDGRTGKEVNKQAIKKEEIFATVRPENRARCRFPANGTDSSPNNTLNISFSPEDPRVPNLDPTNPIVIPAFIQEHQI